MDVYSIVTETIIKQLESGVAPWKKPWQSEAPRNLISGKDYRGINVFLLSASGFPRAEFLTYKQAEKLGASVKPGERSNIVTFWKIGEEKKDAKTGKKSRSFLLRYSRVFNISQCVHGDVPLAEKLGLGAAKANAIGSIESCDAIITGMRNRPAIKVSDRAWYRPSTDEVGIPDKSAFDSAESWYATLYHELTHSTGHASRVGRPGIENLNAFGSESYSKEELVAELGASFLCGVAGISPVVIENSAAYLAGWLKVLQSDSRLIVQAASQAQRAADYIRGISGGL